MTIIVSVDDGHLPRRVLDEALTTLGDLHSIPVKQGDTQVAVAMLFTEEGKTKAGVEFLDNRAGMDAEKTVEAGNFSLVARLRRARGRISGITITQLNYWAPS